MSRRAQLSATALLFALFLGLLIGLPVLTPGPANAEPARQERPTVPPPRPTVAQPGTGEEEEEEEEEGEEGEEGAEEGVEEPTPTTDDEADPADEDPGDETTVGEDDTAVEEGADDASGAEEATPESMPSTGAAGNGGMPLLVLLGGISLGAGAALRRRRRR